MEEAEHSFVNEADESVVIDYQRSADAESDDFMSVDELQNCGIGAIDIQKLKLAGICTIKVRLTKFHDDYAYNHFFTGNSHDFKAKLVQG